RSDVPATRAGARELIGHVLTGGCRDGLLALTDSLPPPERLQAAARALGVPLADRALAAWRASQDAGSPTEGEGTAWSVGQELCRDGRVVLASVARHAANVPAPRDGSMEVHRAAS